MLPGMRPRHERILLVPLVKMFMRRNPCELYIVFFVALGYPHKRDWKTSVYGLRPADRKHHS